MMPDAITSAKDLETTCEMETMLGVKVVRVPQVVSPPSSPPAPTIDAERLRQWCAVADHILASPGFDQIFKAAMLERMRNRGCLN